MSSLQLRPNLHSSVNILTTMLETLSNREFFTLDYRDSLTRFCLLKIILIDVVDIFLKLSLVKVLIFISSSY
jgi:hypothetical protein